MDPGLSRIYTKALWILPTTSQRGYPNTRVHNADHLRVKFGTPRPCWTLPLRQRSGPSSASMTDMRDPHSCNCASADIKKAVQTIWHHDKVCQNGCHKHASLWFLCDVTSMCRVFETSRKQVSFILGSRREIDLGSTAGATLCNTSLKFGQDKSGIRWTNRHSIVHDWL